ncbi:MAG: recombinase family protein [Paracoccaceae bacterium]|nr:recombinase family protein [Paracoccaceae bacterium]
MSSDTRPLAISHLRFSSAEQVRDAKTADQIRRAREWSDENGYAFSETSFSDLGVSAYKGDNSSIGDLGRFLKAVEDGLIPKGSALIIEALDRLSRENQWRGQMLLGNILSNGVDVVTLNDDQRYTFEDLQQDMGVAIRIILAFNLAHAESQQKSRRVTAGWQRNTERVKAGTRLRSKAIPSWLRLIGDLDEGTFEVIPEKADVMRELFERFADGETVWSIAKGFRDRGILTPRGKTYASNNIYRLVASKASFGTLEIGKGTKNDREVVDRIEGYFPRIVSEDVQRRVLLRLQDMDRFKTPASKAITSPKRPTNGILTGTIWSPEKAGGNRAVCRKSTDGSWAYVDSITRRWIAKREIIEDPFIEGWAEIRQASEATPTRELNDAETALEAAQDALEYAQQSGSDRLILAAQADVEEVSEVLKGLRRGMALAMQELPESLEGMESWEINQVVRKVVHRVTVTRGTGRKQKTEGEDGRTGKATMLTVELKNGARIVLGDAELLFSE